MQIISISFKVTVQIKKKPTSYSRRSNYIHILPADSQICRLKKNPVQTDVLSTYKLSANHVFVLYVVFDIKSQFISEVITGSLIKKLVICSLKRVKTPWRLVEVSTMHVYKYIIKS